MLFDLQNRGFGGAKRRFRTFRLTRCGKSPPGSPGHLRATLSASSPFFFLKIAAPGSFFFPHFGTDYEWVLGKTREKHRGLGHFRVFTLLVFAWLYETPKTSRILALFAPRKPKLGMAHLPFSPCFLGYSAAPLPPGNFAPVLFLPRFFK